MADKAIQVLSFMTVVDEDQFSRQLIHRFRALAFIDEAIWERLPPPKKPSIAECTGSVVILLNEDVLSFEEYCSRYIRKHPSGTGYLGGQVGRGLIQFIRSKESRDVPGSLKDGRLAATYDPADATMSAFVKDVWKIFTKGAQKVFAVDRVTGRIAEKPETKYFAWPDAARKYDGRNDRYLTASVFHFYVGR